jgi:unspecific monooxygenase
VSYVHTYLRVRTNTTQDVQSRLRSELQDADPTTLQDISYLTAVIFESLRLLPPISQLINRRVSRPTTLGPMYIPKGMYVGYNCYSTNRDPQAWGPTADEFRPDRWGSTSPDIFKCYRRARAKAEFISFHGGKRACLGEKFALLQLRVTLFVLVRRYQWTLPSTWPDRKTPVCMKDMGFESWR